MTEADLAKLWKGGKVTLSFFPESCRKALQVCGSRSGRDCDKVMKSKSYGNKSNRNS